MGPRGKVMRSRRHGPEALRRCDVLRGNLFWVSDGKKNYYLGSTRVPQTRSCIYNRDISPSLGQRQDLVSRLETANHSKRSQGQIWRVWTRDVISE